MRVKNFAVGCMAAGLISLTACFSVQSQNTEQPRQDGSGMTVSPDVPEKVTFCGEQIDLTRYNMYEGMDRELSSLVYFHSTTMLTIKRANRFFPIIEPILKANGVPDDFKYLAVVESHLDPRVASPARAAGMWQFLESAGREYGLTITPSVDERYNVARATEAACRYLKDAYAKYGDWASAAASYNAGMGRISGAFASQKEASVLNLWLVEETAHYVYRILATKLIFENPQKYGFALRPCDLYTPIACDEVTVTSGIPDLVSFARSHGITYADLKRFNPWLRDSKLVTNGRSFTILIPRKKDLYYTEPNRTVHDRRWVVK